MGSDTSRSGYAGLIGARCSDSMLGGRDPVCTDLGGEGGSAAGRQPQGSARACLLPGTGGRPGLTPGKGGPASGIELVGPGHYRVFIPL